MLINDLCEVWWDLRLDLKVSNSAETTSLDVQLWESWKQQLTQSELEGFHASVLAVGLIMELGIKEQSKRS